MTDLVPARAFDLDLLAREPETVPEALDRQARIDALIRRLNAYREIPREWLERYGRDRVATDGAFNVPIKGTGRTYLDQPEGTFRIANRDVCATWLAAVEPDAVTTVYRPRWPDVDADETRDGLVAVMIEQVAYLSDHDPDRLVERVVVLDEDRALALARANGDYDSKATSTVRYVVPDSGEVWATGIEYVPARDPRLTVKVDPDYAKALDAELAEILDR